jgi:hypothetical protein
MQDTNTELWNDVVDHIDDAKLAAWDGCHKIYLAMDADEAAEMADYPHTFVGTADEMLATVAAWYDQSCGLRFVNAIGGGHDFTDLISQFDPRDPDYDEDDEDDE